MNLKYFLKTKRFVKDQWLSQDKLLEIQNQKLRRLINHAYREVPYYRELFDSAGIKPEDIKNIRDLELIPITRKSKFQELPLDMKISKGTDLQYCMRAKTSGSSGRPLEFILSSEDWMSVLSTLPRFLVGNGRRLRDKVLFIVSPSSFLENPIRYKKGWYEYLGIMRREYISILEDVYSQIETIKRIKPDILNSYPSNLKILAETIIREKIHDIKPLKILYSSAEILSRETRELINSAFKVQMLDFYSAWESGPIAWECHKHEGYHVNIDRLVLEVVRDGKAVPAGVTGEVIITNLNFYTMPFIRYAMEDLAVMSEKACSCGRELPLLEKIEGRTGDFCLLPDGKIVTPVAFIDILKYVPSLGQFRIIQEENNKFIVQIVKKQATFPDKEIIIKTEKGMREVVGNDAVINIQIVREIAKDPSGKLRAVISNVKHEC